MYFYRPQTESSAAAGGARIAAYLPLTAVLGEFGVALRDVLTVVGIPADIFEDPDSVISYPDAARLLRVSAEMANCDHLGLLVGQCSSLDSLGLAGKAALRAETVGEGLRNLSADFALHNTAAVLSVISAGRSARLVYAITEPGTGDTGQLQQGALALAFNVLRHLCGSEWLPTLVTLASRAPASTRELQRFFHAPVCFDSPESALVFESRWLNQPLPRSFTLDASGRGMPAASAAARAVSFPTELGRIVRRELLLGDASMDHVAALLGLQRRTLGRRLEQHGTTYSEVVERAKRIAACQLLGDTELPIQQIADHLNYSCSANFSTAFHRWMGVTPRSYRSQAHRAHKVAPGTLNGVPGA
jgi:AraC-like DNA-binding protein